MSQFIIIHAKNDNEPVAINADYILTIYTGETGTTITTRQKQIIWCTEAMGEILQMIGAVAGYPTKDSDGCKGCIYEHFEQGRDPCCYCKKCFIDRYKRRPRGEE